MPANNQIRPEDVGGFNPERPKETKKPQVGLMPTDDPRKAASSDLKRKIRREADKSHGE